MHKDFLKKISFFSFLFLGLITITNYYEDPMHFYNYDPSKKLFHHPVMERYTDRWQGYGLIHSYPHDLLVVGSSVARFPLKEVEKTYHLKSLRISMVGANFKEMAYVVKASPAQRIIWICDQENADLEDKGDFPTLWYEKKWNRHLSYLWQLDILIASFSNIFNRFMKQLPSADIFSFSCDEHKQYGEKYVMGYYQKMLTLPFHFSFKKRLEEFNKYVVNTIQQYPNKKFDVILPPASLYFYLLYEKKGFFPQYLLLRSHIIQSLLHYKNVCIFDMESDSSLTAVISDYYDLRHHSSNHYKKILTYIKERKNLITYQNMKFFNERFDQTVKNFLKATQKKNIKISFPVLRSGLYR